METKEINNEDAFVGLDTITTEKQFLEKTTLPPDIAELVFSAYRKGVDEYQMKFWNSEDLLKSATERAETAVKRFKDLAVKYAETVILLKD